jgi:hypothetical protein
MTFLEAATEILKQNGNQPMSSREIWNKISEQNLVSTLGKTPWASLNTILLYHSKPEYGKTIYFDILSEKPMKFILSNLNTIHLGVEKIDNTPEVITQMKTLIYSVTSKELEWKKLSIYTFNESIEYEISNCEEYTYIIEDKAHATIKIGKTKNDPEIRFNQLKTANPSIKLLHVFSSSQWSENELHSKFSDFQKDLEWFFFTKGLKTFLSEEISKHEKILSAYQKKIELEKLEKHMFELI